MGLFSTTIHRHENAPAYPQTVHEHKAPTDESVRLLREMEESARDRVIAAWVPEKGNMVGAVVQMRRRHDADASDIWVRFEINGTKFEERFDGPDSRTMDLDEAVSAFVKSFAQHVTEMVVRKLLRGGLR